MTVPVYCRKCGAKLEVLDTRISWADYDESTGKRRDHWRDNFERACPNRPRWWKPRTWFDTSHTEYPIRIYYP